ncbi:hypothetical protein [Streptomyces sp. NPDC055299]
MSEQTRQANEAAIRAAMVRMLAGDLPEGGKCDIKTLAALSGVVRTGFYPKKSRDGTSRPGPYQHLTEVFEQRLTAHQTSGTIPDPPPTPRPPSSPISTSSASAPRSSPAPAPTT